MIPNKPHKTAADLMIIALSPALIMALVGSLCFFLIEVFYRGKMVASVRWVMFWFVVAIVLVSRIAIEKSSEYAAMYGLALAATIWFYLVRTQPSYLLGIVLLAVVWFCAYKLVWDCTLIDEDEDSSGSGLLQSRPSATTKPESKPEPNSKAKPKRVVSSSPGLWVVYFSLDALPLFGIGQALLPAGAAESRRMGLIFVVVYMGAALGLLITTSFLGLRRYLRQRYMRMPPAVAWSWLKLGVGVAVVILAVALFMPRPGANQAWTALHYQIDYRLQQASLYAAKTNPHGQGQGRAGSDAGGNHGESKTAGSQQNNQPAPGSQGTTSSSSGPPPPTPLPGGQAGSIYQFLRHGLLILAALVGGWWFFRRRYLFLEIARSLVAAIVDFFRKLLDLVPARKPIKPPEPAPLQTKLRPLADYTNPFFADQEHVRAASEIILYTFDFVRAWAKDQGIESHPEQTAREFCLEMAVRSPELASAYRHLSFLYGHAAYGLRLPAHYDLEPLKELWRQLTWEQANATAAG
jgi:hypothetical protein